MANHSNIKSKNRRIFLIAGIIITVLVVVVIGYIYSRDYSAKNEDDSALCKKESDSISSDGNVIPGEVSIHCLNKVRN